jgi:hypothetical protein
MADINDWLELKLNNEFNEPTAFLPGESPGLWDLVNYSREGKVVQSITLRTDQIKILFPRILQELETTDWK